MLVLRRPDPLPAGVVACIGAFDGLHRGHRALFDRAAREGVGVALVTFWPHPAAVLAPDRAPPLLQSPTQRVRVARAAGLAAMAMLTFDREVAAMTPVRFTDHFLVEGLRPAGVVVGEDFRYGARRAGDVATLRADLQPHGIEVHVVEEVSDDDGRKLGSTAVREHLDAGEVAAAAEILGRWHAVEGTVLHGAARGRELGFRTANVRSDGAMVPARGVYAVLVSVTDPAHPDFGAVWPATANVGQNPTFADGAATTTGLEVHVMDRDLGDSLYDRRIEVGFVARLRDEKRFDGVEQLRAAIETDVEAARRVFAGEPAAALPGRPPLDSERGMVRPAPEDLEML